MLQTWNAKMDFKRDLIVDVKTKEETIDASLFEFSSDRLVVADLVAELFRQCQSQAERGRGKGTERRWEAPL